MTDEKKTDGKEAWADPSPIEHGGRVELRLIESDENGGRYAARWFTANDELRGEVRVNNERGGVEIDSPETLPEWLNSFTSSLVRTTARKAAQDNAWPRRLTRWRKAPPQK